MHIIAFIFALGWILIRSAALTTSLRCLNVPAASCSWPRTASERLGKLHRHESLRRHVLDKLRSCWSSQQIARRLQLDSKDGRTVCHETV